MIKGLISKLSFAFIAISMALFVGSCAGGTRGTGGEIIQGSVVTRANLAVSGVKVTVLETGDEGITDANGNFSIESEISGTQLSLGIDSRDFSGSVVLTDLPADAKTVTVTIELDEENESVESRDVEIEEHQSGDDDHDGHGANSPTPTPKSSRTAAPQLPTPTAAAAPTQTTPPLASPVPTTAHETPDSEETPNVHEDVEAEGAVQAINSSSISVNGKIFVINSETRFTNGSQQIGSGNIHVGDQVHVYGTRSSGQNIATRIDLSD